MYVKISCHTMEQRNDISVGQGHFNISMKLEIMGQICEAGSTISALEYGPRGGAAQRCIPLFLHIVYPVSCHSVTAESLFIVGGTFEVCVSVGPRGVPQVFGALVLVLGKRVPPSPLSFGLEPPPLPITAWGYSHLQGLRSQCRKPDP